MIKTMFISGILLLSISHIFFEYEFPFKERVLTTTEKWKDDEVFKQINISFMVYDSIEKYTLNECINNDFKFPTCIWLGSGIEYQKRYRDKENDKTYNKIRYERSICKVENKCREKTLNNTINSILDYEKYIGRVLEL